MQSVKTKTLDVLYYSEYIQYKFITDFWKNYVIFSARLYYAKGLSTLPEGEEAISMLAGIGDWNGYFE